jgi:PadR family transcriptional regulator PadR
VPSRHDPQLLKGVLTVLLLRLLAERESYGYEVVQRLHGHGLDNVLEGTVYPALARLERERCLVSRLVASDSGPARKYYRVTPTGYDVLTAATASWLDLVDVVTAVLQQPMPTRPGKGE